MQKIRTYAVRPAIPEPLKDLKTLAYNMFWAWNSDFVDIFRRIDHGLWRQCSHNPVALLGSVSQGKLIDLSQNEGFLYQLNQAMEKLHDQLNAPTWYEKAHARTPRPVIAYFSAEFGIHECLSIYSGGLGVLAGDHLKSASDLGVPLTGIGLLYQKGYFRQYLNSDGWQQEHLVEQDFYNMPLELVRDQQNSPLTISVDYPGRQITAQIWKLKVGRVDLYLLDTNIPQNAPADRLLTRQLYGGDVETRIQQEIMLGIGGMNALIALGLEPDVCHMNEGHAAFMALQRVKRLMETRQMTFNQALEAAKSSNIFTVHTPVAAGNDEFQIELVEKYFKHYYPSLGLNLEQFLALGRTDSKDQKERFKMPVLAIRMSTFRNGVSQLHGKVSRKMWASIWPDVPEDEIPIKSITNGIHAKTWMSGEINELYERYLGSNWADEAVDKSIWQNIDQIPDEELWRIHQRCKERLISFARKRLRSQMQRRGSYYTQLEVADEVLDPEALTIGFARRFASYKRGNLILREPQRLLEIMNSTDKPVQFIFAGKAHPKDSGGKEIIKEIFHFASQDPARRKMVFLEDYDMDVARYLVQGVDVWLNNPRRPLEASGTSGMKAAMNGVLNLSTLDGWWCEGYIPEAGWVIGAGEEYSDTAYGDLVESQALYNLLENEVIEAYYDRPADKLPRAWIRRMKNTIKWCTPRFNTSRMIAEYTRRFYNPAAARWQYLTEDSMSRVIELAQWKERVRKTWSDLSINDVDVRLCSDGQTQPMDSAMPQLEVGAQIEVSAKVSLGRLTADDVSVEIFQGKIDSSGNITHAQAERMSCISGEQDGTALFQGTVSCRSSGQHGLSVRIMPAHPDMAEPYEPGLILWEGSGKKKQLVTA